MKAFIISEGVPKIIPKKTKGIPATPEPTIAANKNIPKTTEIRETPKILKK